MNCQEQTERQTCQVSNPLCAWTPANFSSRRRMLQDIRIALWLSVKKCQNAVLLVAKHSQRQLRSDIWESRHSASTAQSNIKQPSTCKKHLQDALARRTCKTLQDIARHKDDVQWFGLKGSNDLKCWWWSGHLDFISDISLDDSGGHAK